MATYIHISAVSPYFEIHEIIAESKAVKRLEGIKKSFHWYDKNANFMISDARLKVTTGVHNPKLPFKD